MVGSFWILHLARVMMTQWIVTILSYQSAVSIVFRSHFSIASARSGPCWRWYKKSTRKQVQVQL